VHVLTHPTGLPFHAFLGEEAVRRPRVLLPRPTDLVAMPVAEVVKQALAWAEPTLTARGIHVVLEGTACEASICDMQARVPLALFTALCQMAVEAATAPVPLWCIEKPTRIGVVLGAPLADPAVQTIAALIAPLGGRLKNTQERSILYFSRA
jgi:hypothetical protein